MTGLDSKIMDNRSPSPTQSSPIRPAPIVIVGGGLTGLTLAVALGSNGLPVVLIETLPLDRVTQPGFDGRVSAIAASSVRLFKALGLWAALEPHAQPINDILVSDGRPGEAPSPMTLHFDPRKLARSDEAVEPLGHLLENRHMRQVLIEAISILPHVKVMAPAGVLGLDQGAASVAVLIKDHDPIHAQLVIAADGRHSRLRKGAGIKSIGWDYTQSAIVTTVEHDQPHHGVAHELFLPSGPFAILPMVGNRSSIVWTEHKRLAPKFMALSDDDFSVELARRFGAHWGAVRPVGPRWSYPLGLHLARSYVKPRLALIGDAAHAIHPIAGQGFNLGLRDVAALSQVLIEGARLGRDLGDLHLLNDYERWRRSDNVILAAATDGLTRLFSTDSGPIRLARDLGIGMVAKIAPLKNLFMRHAMGDVGVKPKLLDGLPI